MTRISAYLSMNAATLPEASAEAARKAGGEWVIVNVRGGRQLVSCLAPEALIPALLGLLAPYSPTLIGVWDVEGNALTAYPINVSDYLSVMPDDAISNGADAPATLSRPTVPRDVCFWAGWAERTFA